jgi:hypothetical protein
VLETVGGAKVSCGAGHFSGEALVVHGEDGKSVSVNITLAECRNAAGRTCQSNPALAGVIGTQLPLEGVTEFTRGGEKPRVGLVLYPKEGSSRLFTFECGAAPEPFEEWVVVGSTIGSIRPLDTMSTTFQLILKAKEGKQIPEEVGNPGFPGERRTLEASISGGSPEQAGLTIHGERASFPVVFDEAVEIKAK